MLSTIFVYPQRLLIALVFHRISLSLSFITWAQLCQFQFRLDFVVDIDDFVDNFDFIMLIKCYGLKCSTVSQLLAAAVARCMLPAASCLLPVACSWLQVAAGFAPMSSAPHNSLVTISRQEHCCVG